MLRKYSNLAKQWALLPQSKECVLKYMEHMRAKTGKGGAPNTIKTNIAHVKKWIEIAHNNKIQIRVPKNFNHKVNEHEAYPEHHVIELIRELRYQPLKELKRSFASKT